MQNLSELPDVGSISIDGEEIELELEQPMELPDPKATGSVVFTAKYAGQVIVVVGQVLEIENIQGPDVWCRLKMKGCSVTFTI